MNYYFIGIKGSGMSALAEILAELSHNVRGSDIEQFIFTQKGLEARNITIDLFDFNDFSGFDGIVIGNAFAESHAQVIAARASGVACYRYHEFLGMLMQQYESFSVAGTHGKTTTTGMLAHTLAAFGPCGYLIGDGTGHLTTESTMFVVESCEYKRHFLAYHPAYAIITSAELDHVDYYQDYPDYLSAYNSFARQVGQGLAVFGDDPHVMELELAMPHVTYGLKAHNDIQARDVVYHEAGIRFALWIKGQFVRSCDLPFVGEHLLWNALGVLSIVYLKGLDLDLALAQLATFAGVVRRFNIEVERDHVYIDDYAHHPTAIALTIAAAKQKYPNKKIIAVFKPDRFSRIAYFANEFAASFSGADAVYLCDFPANAQKEPGIDFTMRDFLAAVPQATFLKEDEESAKELALEKDTVFLFMSSKDIYKFKDLVKRFHKN
ncbi:MAG: UDP-N-acetylmuramate--L-alanine ligase [Erysipelotrichaceae bacterium]